MDITDALKFKLNPIPAPPKLEPDYRLSERVNFDIRNLYPSSLIDVPTVIAQINQQIREEAEKMENFQKATKLFMITKSTDEHWDDVVGATAYFFPERGGSFVHVKAEDAPDHADLKINDSKFVPVPMLGLSLADITPDDKPEFTEGERVCCAGNEYTIDCVSISMGNPDRWVVAVKETNIRFMPHQLVRVPQEIEVEPLVTRTYSSESTMKVTDVGMFGVHDPEPIFVKATLSDIQRYIDANSVFDLEQSPFWILVDGTDLVKVTEYTDFHDIFDDEHTLMEKVG